MSFQANAEKIVDSAIEKIKVPDISNGFHKALWMQGRDAAIKHARQTVRHFINEPMIHLTETPHVLKKDMGVEGSKFWLDGRETTINFIEKKLNIFIFNTINA